MKLDRLQIYDFAMMLILGILVIVVAMLLAGCSTVKAWRVAGEKLAIASERLAEVETRLYTQTLPAMEASLTQFLFKAETFLSNTDSNLTRVTAAAETVTNITRAVTKRVEISSEHSEKRFDLFYDFAKTTLLPALGLGLAAWLHGRRHGKKSHDTQSKLQLNQPHKEAAP